MTQPLNPSECPPDALYRGAVKGQYQVLRRYNPGTSKPWSAIISEFDFTRHADHEVSDLRYLTLAPDPAPFLVEGTATLDEVYPPKIHEDGTPEWYTPKTGYLLQYIEDYPLSAVRFYSADDGVVDPYWEGSLEEAEELLQALSSVVHYARKGQS